MFSKINFTYKKPGQNSQSYLILREQLVKQKIKENEKKSLINCISLQNKVDSKKVQNTSDTFEQSRESNINYDNNNNNIIDNEEIQNRMTKFEFYNNRIEKALKHQKRDAQTSL